MGWTHSDLNRGPPGYEPDALTSELWVLNGKGPGNFSTQLWQMVLPPMSCQRLALPKYPRPDLNRQSPV